ncbi:MAG TPA: alpha/beta hydrolase [Acetobacteraceae bacterium]|jgi:pimeloyl-ACP methyl ester carboxylesterase|nr:alpha/beta hydrolase [Acetobacteraceae bacterium]
MTSFVLIHGAYQGGWIWREVTARLRAVGHHVLAPSLDGCAERRHQLRAGITTETQAEELAGLLFYEDLRDVVLVGTSSGGMVLCRAAELVRERIGRVVFADALALLDGERIADIVTNRPTPVTTDLSVGPSRDDAAGRLFAGLDPTTREWALARYTLHPIACMQAPVQLDRFWNEDWSASVIWCRQSANPPVAHQRRTAERLKAKWFELDTGHYPMLSTAAELTRLITA